MRFPECDMFSSHSVLFSIGKYHQRVSICLARRLKLYLVCLVQLICYAPTSVDVRKKRREIIKHEAQREEEEERHAHSVYLRAKREEDLLLCMTSSSSTSLLYHFRMDNITIHSV
jgi:hypothetical protein